MTGEASAASAKSVTRAKPETKAEARAAAARQRWLTAAAGELEVYLRTHVEFFSDDFWDHVHGQRSTRRLGSPPGDRRLLGAVVRAAERNGLIAKTGEYRLSRPSSAGHAAPKPVWRSLVFVPPASRD